MRSYKEFGSFDTKAHEFVITNPNTPRPWINYLSNGEYGALISQTGGGFSFYLDAAYNRITRWAPANYLNDRPGRYIYIRDPATGVLSSGTCAPVIRPSSINTPNTQRAIEYFGMGLLSILRRVSLE